LELGQPFLEFTVLGISGQSTLVYPYRVFVPSLDFGSKSSFFSMAASKYSWALASSFISR